jgi:molecular chaperone DnaJ
MTKLEAFRILDISPDATWHRIQTAYRAKARQYHPDRCPDANAGDMMAQVNLAYEVVTSNDVVDSSVSCDYRDLFGKGLDDLKI